MATIVVGVTGGVAAFKAPIVVRECQRAGHDVYVTATRASLDFVGRSTWEGITSRPVAVDIAGEGRAEHVELARIADLIIVVPATANSLARLAAGFADDMVSLTVLASDAPVVVAPAMHSNMWLSPATQANVKTLRERGVHVIDPTSGALGSGDSGVGRLPAPEEIAHPAVRDWRLRRQRREPALLCVSSPRTSSLLSSMSCRQAYRSLAWGAPCRCARQQSSRWPMPTLL